MKALKIKNPPHPGFIVRVDCLEPFGLTVTDGAENLGVARQTLNNLVNEKSNLSLDMAIRLSKAFGGTPEGWMKLQLQYDLAQIDEKAKKVKVKSLRDQLVSAWERTHHLGLWVFEGEGPLAHIISV